MRLDECRKLKSLAHQVVGNNSSYRDTKYGRTDPLFAF